MVRFLGAGAERPAPGRYAPGSARGRARDDMRHSSITALAGAAPVRAGEPARTAGVFAVRTSITGGSAARLAAVLAVLALALAGPGPAAPAARGQSDVSGVWEINLDTQIGEATWTATFEQDGAALSGEIDIGDRTVLPLEGTVDGAALDFTFIVPDLDGDLPIVLSGTIEGATIAGDEGNFVWYGAGRWTGVKQ